MGREGYVAGNDGLGEKGRRGGFEPPALQGLCRNAAAVASFGGLDDEHASFADKNLLSTAGYSAYASSSRDAFVGERSGEMGEMRREGRTDGVARNRNVWGIVRAKREESLGLRS